MSDGCLVSGSEDSTIRIWNMTTYSVVKILNAQSPVRGLLLLRNGNVASSLWNGVIKIWDISSGQALMSLTGHTNAVINIIQLSDHILGSGSYDHTIKLWDLTNGANLMTLRNHTNFVIGLMQLSNGYIVSG